MTGLLRPRGCDKEESALLLESHLWTDRTSPAEKQAAVSFNQGDRFTYETEKRVYILYILYILFVSLFNLLRGVLRASGRVHHMDPNERYKCEM